MRQGSGNDRPAPVTGPVVSGRRRSRRSAGRNDQPLTGLHIGSGEPVERPDPLDLVTHIAIGVVFFGDLPEGLTRLHDDGPRRLSGGVEQPHHANGQRDEDTGYSEYHQGGRDATDKQFATPREMQGVRGGRQGC
jgi:hypothetical protein